MALSHFGAQALRAGGALLAVDPGATYVGLAVCKSPHRFGATPFGLIQRVSNSKWRLREAPSSRGHGSHLHFPSSTAALVHIIKEHNISGVIYGMPFHADGSFSRECHRVESEALALQAAISSPMPVLLWDESFTTREAIGHGGASRMRDHVWAHSAAACIILQEVLNILRQRHFISDSINQESGPNRK